MIRTRPNYPLQVSSPRRLHSLSPGGMDMKIKHTHPQYQSDKERLDRLKEMRRLCISALSKPRVGKR